MTNKKLGFDNALYLENQSKKILEKVENAGGKLYLEFGGKLFNDYHASRVLPGFSKDAKIELLTKLKDKAEIIFCVSSNDIEKNRQRAELGLSYENEILSTINNLRENGLYVSAVVITLFRGQPSANKFAENLQAQGEKVYFHSYTKGYPSDVDLMVSEEGYGQNPYIQTTRPLVVVTAGSPCTGKLATCLSQLYHEFKNGKKAGFAKFETFPVFDLPLGHPVNIAYEAATADIKSINQIDPFHFNAYGTLSVNYNHDIEVFPVLKNILKKITGEEKFKSPTDLGVNVVKSAIVDDEIVCDHARKEIIRRYYKTECDYKRGKATFETRERNRHLLSELDITEEYLPVIPQAKSMSKKCGLPCVALQLPNGEIVYGKNKTVVSASGAVILNALRTLAGLGDDFDIISDDILMPILSFRKDILKNKKQVLSLDDILIALSVSANNNEKAKKALAQLPLLEGVEAHATYMIPQAEELTFKKLGINISCQPALLKNK